MRKIIQLIHFLSFALGVCLIGKLWGVTGPVLHSGPVQMSLVFPSSGITPNSTVWIGWWIEREEGWHTYWEHPGNVGLAPHLEWSMAPGLNVGDLQFPYPKRVQMAGVKAYGHHGNTLFLAKLEVPSLTVGTEVKLVAKARWMVCSNVCLPEYNELSIILPVVESAVPDSAWQSRFEDFLQNRPLPVPRKWKLEAVELGKFTRLKISHPQPMLSKDVYFFGGSYLVCSDSGQQLRLDDSQTEILLPKPPWPEENPTHLHGLLRISDKNSSANYYTIEVPLK